MTEKQRIYWNSLKGKWVTRNLGKARKCSFCGKEGMGRQIHWANISQNYKRDLTDWVQLCAQHHGAYDAGKISLGLLTLQARI